MEQANNIFKAWAPGWLIKGVLIYCMLPSMMLLGLYNSNTTYTASYLDIEPEDMQFIISLTYGTLLATVLIEARFFRYFSTRNYFLCINAISALVLILSAYTTNYYQFIMLRIAEGLCMALPGVSLRMLLMSRFKTNSAMIIAYSIFYGILLCSSTFTIHIMVWLMDNSDWQHMAYGGALFQVLGMGLILLVFNTKRFTKKLPLYQVDWVSYLLVLPGILCGSYVLVYGEKLYWFQSGKIAVCAIIAVVFMGLFVLRQLRIKRPAFNMNVFRNKQVIAGMLLFVFFYTCRATLNLCYATMSDIWRWEPIYIAHVQYINVAGLIAGLILAGLLLHQAVASHYIILSGFVLLAVYHFWFTFLFVPDAALQQIAVPYFLQGAGVGMVFIPLVFLTTSTVAQPLALSAGFAAVSGRFWGTSVGFCVVQNAKVFLQRTHYSKLQQFVTPESTEAQGRLASLTASFTAKGYSADAATQLAYQQLHAAVSRQSTLLSYMEIYTAVGWALLAVVIVMILNKHLLFSINKVKQGTMKLMPRTMW